VLGGWPTRGLPRAGHRGPVLGCCTVAGRGLAHTGRAVPVSRQAGRHWLLLFSGGRVVINPFATRTLSTLTQCARSRVAPTGVANLGRRGLFGSGNTHPPRAPRFRLQGRTSNLEPAA